ncbi:hypothetical protein AMAG_03535 [Allomyces macrogynus ATCC 38327]|uniref:C2 domain-containing protein n=1 Tax=Allomyces macrogynus (strain ATCC 38327) TaxID=578462 RepID=A0A0L0S9T4_ALLM3|nr:hypothetical protein AMAG_03535 [Allomyces macrogynus ATCC 38327]|eukprot:KNE59216.1 hypothetical protein AMAG_03535 [Allomyces macrogynus ATCC 38327]
MTASLEINIVEARGLKDEELIGKIDSYFIVLVGGEKQRTRTFKDSGKNPTINERLSFTLPEGVRQFNLEVYDDDFGKDDFIGGNIVDLSRAFATGREETWVPLLTRMGRRAGEVHIIISTRQGNANFQQGQAQQQGQYNQGGNPQFNQGGNPQFNQGGNPQFLQQSSSPVQSSYKPVKDHSTLETVAMVGAGVAGAAALGFLGKQALDAYKKKDHKDGAHPSAPAAGKH